MFGLCDLIPFLLCLVFFILGYVLRLKLDKKVFTIQERYNLERYYRTKLQKTIDDIIQDCYKKTGALPTIQLVAYKNHYYQTLYEARVDTNIWKKDDDIPIARPPKPPIK